MAIEKVTIGVARKIAGFTQKEMAKRCGVSEDTVSNWERYKTEMSVSKARKYAQVCGLEYDDIIFLP